jgi:hypothetical protein
MRVQRSLVAAGFFSASLGLAPVASAQTPTTPSAQLETACYRTAKEHQLTSETRKAFLSDCLNGGGTVAPEMGAETCRARAEKADDQKLIGEARKLFMSGCIKDQ